MKRDILLGRTLRTLCLIGLLAGGNSPVWPEEERAVSAETYAVLKKADSQLRKGNARLAVQELQALKAKTEEHTFEFAVVRQYLAYALAETGDLRGARRAADAAMGSNLLPADAVHDLHYLAGQIAFRQESYHDSAVHLAKWLKQEPRAGADIHYMAGYAAYRAKMFRAATGHLEKAVALRPSPAEEWMRLLLSIYIDQKQYAKAESLIKRLIANSPQKREWWRYLSGLYAQQGRDDLALSTLMVAYYGGDVKREDIMQVVRLNAHQGYPAKAARLLESELRRGRIPRSYDNLKLLFGCWQLARERAQARRVLAEAASLAPRGEDFLLLGQIDIQLGDWESAKDQFQKALRKGGLKRRSRARLLLGIAAFNANDATLARQSLLPLLSDNAVKQEAAYWLNRLDRKKSRAEHAQTPHSSKG